MTIHHTLAALRDRRELISGLIFVCAVVVRLFYFYEPFSEIWKVQTSVVEGYFYTARFLMEDGPALFFSPGSRVSHLNLAGHPPGYPALLALVALVFGESMTAIQLVQIVLDAVMAVVVFLIAVELLPVRVAGTAGMLMAFSPQFAYHSVLLLPDSLSVLPIVLAVYLIVRAGKRPRIMKLVVAGVLVGLSCWLRANALLLIVFLVPLVLLLFERGKWLSYSLALVCGAILTIAPLTIRNAVVHGHFIPISLGAGQTLLEGIADYDEAGRFGLPNDDVGITRMEAEIYGRPDYYGSLFFPEGVARERLRIRRGVEVIRANPLWFLGVMAQRAASMFRLERVPPITARPTVAGKLAYVFVRGLLVVFSTAVMLPLVVAGIVLLARSRVKILAVLLAVPAYFFCVQSALHTEYRYVLAVHCFLFVLAAVAIDRIYDLLRGARRQKAEI